MRFFLVGRRLTLSLNLSVVSNEVYRRYIHTRQLHTVDMFNFMIILDYYYYSSPIIALKCGHAGPYVYVDPKLTRFKRLYSLRG